KVIDENDKTTLQVEKSIKKVFPFYLDTYNLARRKRETPLHPDELTNRELEAASLSVRDNDERVYKEVSEEYNNAGDINHSLHPSLILSAREDIRLQQEMIIKDLEYKVKQSPDKASDEFMYQDKEEAQKELEIARQILDELTPARCHEDFKYRVWNPLPYHRYIGSDEEDEE